MIVSLRKYSCGYIFFFFVEYLKYLVLKCFSALTNYYDLKKNIELKKKTYKHVQFTNCAKRIKICPVNEMNA